MLKKLSLFHISSGEDFMTFHVFLFLLVVCLHRRCFGVCAGSLFSLPAHQQGADTPRCTVFSGPAPRLSVPSVASPPQVLDQPLRKSRPWSEVKSRRRALKRVNTEGFACPNQQCLYFGITDADIHALVGDGKHGHAERIQTFRCQDGSKKGGGSPCRTP